MDAHCEKHIQPWLDAAPPLSPKPTDITPRVAHDPDIRAIIFDVYGTLLISSSGDIDLAFFSEENILKALEHSGVRLTASDPSSCARDILAAYAEEITREHELHKAAGIPHPEIEIRAIWQRVLTKFDDLLVFPDTDPAHTTACLSFLFELFSNPIAPMPGMSSVLSALDAHDFLLGIVSNAQFYTPVVLSYYLTGTFSSEQSPPLFREDLCMYSFTFKRAKPDVTMYQRVCDVLRDTYNLAPHNALFVGNDMRNDVIPAHTAGMRTALFAGDARSLRTRDLPTDGQNGAPDHIITHLEQIAAIVGITQTPSTQQSDT